MNPTATPDAARPFDRLPPHSVESEMCLIGSMLMLGDDRATAAEVRATVTADDFYQADHSIMFATLAAMAAANTPVDAMTFREELTRRQVLAECGGLEYLAALLHSTPNAAHAAQYARDVRECAALRRVIAVANDALRAAYGPSRGPHAAEVARRYADALTAIACRGTTDPVVTLATAAEEVLFRKDEPATRRIPTRIKGLDDVIGGLGRGELTIIGADPRVGKSALIKQILMNVASAEGGLRCGLVTVEERSAKVAENMLALSSGVANHRIAHNTLDATEWKRVARSAGGFVDLPYFLDDKQSALGDVVAAVERMATKYRCDVVAVDHMHIIQAGGENREREISRVADELKHVFRRTNVAGIAAAQFNRGADAREKPVLRSLKGAQTLEANGDVILLLWREDLVNFRDAGFTPSGQMDVTIAKNKSGAMGEVPLYFNGATQSVIGYRTW